MTGIEAVAGARGLDENGSPRRRAGWYLPGHGSSLDEDPSRIAAG
jgi:hypothetical protein